MRIRHLGNPLESEVSAFRWLVVILVAGVTVALVAKLISAQAGLIYGAVLLLLLGVLIIRGVAHLLGSPDDDDANVGADEGDGVRAGEAEDRQD